MATRVAPTEGPHWQRLGLAVGSVLAIYALLLQPVAVSFEQLDRAAAGERSLQQRIEYLQRQNAVHIQDLKRRERQVSLGAKHLAALALQLQALEVKEHALKTVAASVSVPAIGSLPAVHAVTGASGLP